MDVEVRYNVVDEVDDKSGKLRITVEVECDGSDVGDGSTVGMGSIGVDITLSDDVISESFDNIYSKMELQRSGLIYALSGYVECFSTHLLRPEYQN